MKRARSRGAALLVAMLTVTLVTTLAAAALWQQWRSVEIESAERTRVQAQWILTGALDWARLILREDARSSRQDHLAEPWAVPLEEARLATFLAADRDNTADAGAEDTFLSGRIIDRQAMLNLSTLLATGEAGEAARNDFARLFQLLGLPRAELDRLAENLRFAGDLHVENRSSARAPLVPQQVSQLVWLGVAPATAAALEPYVTILPRASTPVNLNTAPAEVIYAVARDIGLAEAQRVVAARGNAHFREVADAARLLPDGALRPAAVDVKSAYFEVRGRLRIRRAVIEQRSLVFRERTLAGEWVVRTLSREHAPPEPPPAEAAGRR